MNEEILKFIESKRLAVLAVAMDDGSPHGAIMHFAYRGDTGDFVFLTDKNYMKSRPLMAKESTKATAVIGFDENEMKTLQLDGKAALSEKKSDKEVYFKKFPDKCAKFDGPNDIIFTFTPTWWRYTEWSSEGKRILSSDG